MERKPFSKDRRVIYASITSEGRKLMDEIFPKHQRAIQHIFASLDESEKETMGILLKKLGFYAQGLNEIF